MRPELIIRETAEEDYDEVLHFITMVDGEFHPPLSERGETIEARVKRTLATQNSNYLVAQMKNPESSDCLKGFVGLIGYTKEWRGKSGVYINFLATTPTFRNYGISNLLCTELEKLLASNGSECIYLCTWSSNMKAVRFYRKLGYRIYSVILNDRGNGIHTLNYRKMIFAREVFAKQYIRLDNRVKDKINDASVLSNSS